MKMHAFPSVLGFRTLSTSPTVVNSVFSSGCFHATKAHMVFFGDFYTLVDTEGSEFRACIWPMGRVFTVPAFVPLLVGSFDLQGID